MTAWTDHLGRGPLTRQSDRAPSSVTEKVEPISRAHYRLRLAGNTADLRAAQVLRFVVFNLELQEGLEQSYSTCLDADAFDEVCDHLLVEDLRTGEVIGTYRLQTGPTAAAKLGYYSAQEFDFSPYEPWRHELVELGRACVHSSHRNFVVLSLLWKGIANYAKSHGCRYLIGCSSLTSQDPALGLAAYREIQRYLVPEQWRTNPLPPFACSADQPAVHAPKIPKLLTAYLALGARICGPPALDKEFKTIDFLTFLDLYAMPAKMMARYMD
ncbi:MAG: family N-acetyltransferase [Pedosphaera sp.]|nr:family N-acetyltransferase [Pedosphaera sp.]